MHTASICLPIVYARGKGTIHKGTIHRPCDRGPERLLLYASRGGNFEGPAPSAFPLGSAFTATGSQPCTCFIEIRGPLAPSLHPRSKTGKWSRLLKALQTDSDDEWHSLDSTINRAHHHAAGGKSSPWWSTH
jgi:hypothetical protein